MFSFIFFVTNSVTMIICVCSYIYTHQSRTALSPTVQNYPYFSILMPTWSIIYLFHLSSLYKKLASYFYVFNWMKLSIFSYIYCPFFPYEIKLDLYSVHQCFRGRGTLSVNCISYVFYESVPHIILIVFTLLSSMCKVS